MSEGRARPAGGSEPSCRCARTPGMDRVVPRPRVRRCPSRLWPGWERGQREQLVRGNEAGFCVWGGNTAGNGVSAHQHRLPHHQLFPDEVKVRLVPGPAVAAEGGS